MAGAVYAYNHSAAYVAQVLALAQSLAAASSAGTSVSGAGAVAVAWALSQIGTPYVWGGEAPGVGFDCSGLVQAAYRVAGVALPRVAQDQYDTTPKLAPGAPLAPGDLVFFGAGTSAIDHVGLFVGSWTVTTSWSTHPIPARTCGPRPSRPRRGALRKPALRRSDEAGLMECRKPPHDHRDTMLS